MQQTSEDRIDAAAAAGGEKADAPDAAADAPDTAYAAAADAGHVDVTNGSMPEFLKAWHVGQGELLPAAAGAIAAAQQAGDGSAAAAAGGGGGFSKTFEGRHGKKRSRVARRLELGAAQDAAAAGTVHEEEAEDRAGMSQGLQCESPVENF
jgi:hypothetical protein